MSCSHADRKCLTLHTAHPITLNYQRLLTAFIASIGVLSGSAVADNSTIELDNMVISASSTQHEQLTAPAFTTVISSDTIMSTPAASLADLIGKTTGAINLTDSSGRDELSLRGMSGGYTLILVNGKRVSSSDALWRGGDFDYSSLPFASIERIEIVRGPMSSLYGADAMGGVINIITKQASATWSGRIASEYRAPISGDDGDQLRTSISAAGPLSDNLFLSINAEASQRDPWFADDGDGATQVADIEEKNTRNLQSTLTWDINDEQSLDVDLMINKDDRPYAAYGDPDSFRDQSISRTTLGLTHHGYWQWGDTSLMANYESGSIDDYNSSYDAPQKRRLEEKNLTLGGKAHMELDRHHLTTGFEYRDQTVSDDVSYYEDGESSISQAAVFVQDEITLTDKLTLTLGGRYDDHEIFGGEFTPRGYVVYQIADGWAVKGGVSKAFKAPDAYQLNDDYRIVSCGGSCYLSGNPDLAAETSLNYEIGIEAQQQDWSLSAVYFVTNVDDMITATYDAATNSRMWINEDNVKIKGLELDGRLQMNRQWAVNLGYAYLDTEDTNGDPLPNRSRHTLTSSLQWSPSQDLHATLSASYRGKQDYYGETLQAYTVFDLAGQYTAIPNWTLRAGINNVTDENLYDEDSDYNYNVLGRSLFISAAYAF